MKRRLPTTGGAPGGRGPAEPLSSGSGPVEPPVVREALRTVIDPEVGLDIVTMGLVYGVEVEDGVVRVTFTLTTPGCPLAAVIRDAVEAAVSGVEGVERVEADLVWEPCWHPGMIEEGAW